MTEKACALCTWTANAETEEGVKRELAKHKSTRLHRVNYLKYFYQKNKNELLGNKKDVELSCAEVEIQNLTAVGETYPKSSCTFNIGISNRGSSVLLICCEFLHKLACRFSISDENEASSGKRVLRIPAGCPDPYFVKVEMMPEFVGIYQAPLVFQFMRDDVPFFLGIEIVVKCADDIVRSLQDSLPYKGNYEKDIRRPAVEIKKGVKPRSEVKVHYELELKPYKIDNQLKKSILDLQNVFKQSWALTAKESRQVKLLKTETRQIYDFLQKQLQRNNYQLYFNLILNLEEVQMEMDIRKYDMRDVVMQRSTRNPSLLSLHVLGLAEKRPSVLKGDKLYVRIAKEVQDIEYEGFVHEVQETNVLLGFGNELLVKYLPNMRFHVRFVYNQMPMQVMLRALTMVTQDHIDHWFFPNFDHAGKCKPVISPTESLIFYNRSIESNPEQANAIKHIVAGSSLPAPYLLHGPPGTGKTVTLVEAIMQIWKLYRKEPYKAFILVCTPSNSASDLIVEKLLRNLPKAEMLRFYSMSRDLKSVPEAIQEKKCFNYDFDKKRFFIPSKKVLMGYRIIVSTLCNSSRLVSLGIGKDHFTHVFLDECGHAVEAEAISPLVGLLNCRQAKDDDFGGQIVLAGDPKQLGPVIRCRVAQEYGLTTSLLERLMELKVYQRLPNRIFDPKLLTRLRNNYRSHPAILKKPNELFYDGELRECADKLQRESLCHWEGLPNRKFPVLFHGVIGRDMQEAKNPSYFNPMEVSVVIDNVDRLLSSRTLGMNIKHKEIGIISPYRQQVYKIRNELSKRRLNDISVGSVDEFQGQERRVIIISTVRSTPDLMSYDAKYQLGFLKNPKRFNVALTRAKCLLIVIGNPNLLSKDYHWNQFLLFCKENGSYVGANYEYPEDEAEDVYERFQALNLVPVERETVSISQRAKQEDPEWRSDF